MSEHDDLRSALSDRAFDPGSGVDRACAPGRFSLLYESEDGRLCVFEDADGHVSAVDARRFA